MCIISLDLLQFKENLDMSKREPVSYPRNEWFYLEDNRLEQEEENKGSEYVILFL